MLRDKSMKSHAVDFSHRIQGKGWKNLQDFRRLIPHAITGKGD
jgi:hypothetical protein